MSDQGSTAQIQLAYKVVLVPFARIEWDRGYHKVAGVELLQRLLNDLADEWEIVQAGTSPGDAVILQRRSQ